MRLKFDNEGYVCCILYGCMTDSCVEYTGLVPTQPEEYEDMDDWANRAQTQVYYLNDQGNLIYDADKAASLPAEDDIAPLTNEQLEKLGIKDAIRSGISENATIIHTIAYPIGSVYLRADDIDPNWFWGGSWEQIASGISGVYAWKRIE